MATAALELSICSLEASHPHRKGFKFLLLLYFLFVGWVLVDEDGGGKDGHY